MMLKMMLLSMSCHPVTEAHDWLAYYIFRVIVSPTYGEQRGWACMSVSSRPCLASQSIFGVFTRGLWNPTSFHPVKGNKTWLVVYAKKQLICTYMHIKIVLKEGNKLWSTHLIINIIGWDKDRVYYFAYSSLGDAMAVNCSTLNTSGFFIKQRMCYSIITCALWRVCYSIWVVS